MTVQELMEVLKNMDPDQEVNIWNNEFDSIDVMQSVEVNQEGDLVLYY